ncbi:hypothetical protein ACPPTR_06115 [Ralstonia pseudosolanacearum]|uniref:hypothetical protein n=1 Tax=Ralstonia pseudosolanacearum TaxID=1310165 RepID=UPI000B92E84C|nr:hypothetical protein [Ralstonia pseudosolanacearum]MCD9230441.1 hypothetical protein [Ralstonia pseudosolanacearum]
MLKPAVKFETRKAQRLYASLLEHQAQMRASGELARELSESRRCFWKSTFLMCVTPLAIITALFTGALTYFGAGLEQTIFVGGVGAIMTLVGFLTLYPRA